jgi:hypothetical protein
VSSFRSDLSILQMQAYIGEIGQKYEFFWCRKVKALITKLNTCKATVNLELSCATLYVSFLFSAEV